MMLALYEKNKGYIAQNLCEHRKNPAKKCSGKCYLRKQMQKNDCEKNPCGDAPVKKTSIEVLVFVLQPNTHAYTFTSLNKPPQVPVVKQFLARLMAYSIFQPPRWQPSYMAGCITA
jgi:hypothetical protein